MNLLEFFKIAIDNITRWAIKSLNRLYDLFINAASRVFISFLVQIIGMRVSGYIVYWFHYGMSNIEVRFNDYVILNLHRVEELRTLNDMVNANHFRRFLEVYQIHVDIVLEKLEQRWMASTNQGLFRKTLGHIRRVNNDFRGYLRYFSLCPYMNYTILGVEMVALAVFLLWFVH